MNAKVKPITPGSILLGELINKKIVPISDEMLERKTI
jgi:hypothetical protein